MGGVTDKVAYVDRTYNEMMLMDCQKPATLCAACGLPVNHGEGCIYGILVVEHNFIAHEVPRKWAFHKKCTPALARMVTEYQGVRV